MSFQFTHVRQTPGCTVNVYPLPQSGLSEGHAVSTLLLREDPFTEAVVCGAADTGAVTPHPAALPRDPSTAKPRPKLRTGEHGSQVVEDEFALLSGVQGDEVADTSTAAGELPTVSLSRVLVGPLAKVPVAGCSEAHPASRAWLVHVSCGGPNVHQETQ